MSFSLIYTNHPSLEEAKKIVRILLEERLIACANIFPIESMYTWKGDISESHEIVTLLKTRTENKQKVEKRLEELSNYEIPCIIQLTEVTANTPFAQWIQDETSNF